MRPSFQLLTPHCSCLIGSYLSHQIPEELRHVGFETFRPLLAEHLGKVLLNESLPEPVKQTYEKLSFLSAVHGLQYARALFFPHPSPLSG